MLKREFYFWLDRLQISPAERYLIVFLFTTLFFITMLRSLTEPSVPYDEEFYAPISEEFKRLSAMKAAEDSALMARYFPASQAPYREFANRIPAAVEGTKGPERAFSSESGNIPGPGSAAADSTEKIRINVNTAGIDELIQIPGIGQVIAQRLVTYRNEHGDFESVDDLLNVAGIGEARLKNIKPYLEL